MWKGVVAIASCVLLSVGLARSDGDAEEQGKAKQYTVNTFPQEINKNNHFIMFYAPWCTHCKRLKPTWEELANVLNKDDGSSKVTIAKVDCTLDTALCSENDVTGYPTLKFFGKNSKESIKFKGTRDLPSLTNFLNEQLGTDVINGEDSKESKTEEPENGLIELTDSNFKQHLAEGNHFVKFYAPWCGHCQRLAPTWELVAGSFAGDNSVSIAKIDCTVNRDACKSYDIKSYPTLLWIENGEKIDKYQGQRSLEELTGYVAEMQGGSSKGELDNVIPVLSPVITLTGDNFKLSIENGINFVKYFAPWCGHCKGLAPTWEELGKKFVPKSNIKIASVDCTIELNKELCNEQEVDGFPTLILYKDGKKISEYNGSRGLEDLYDFVTKHSTHDEL